MCQSQFCFIRTQSPILGVEKPLSRVFVKSPADMFGGDTSNFLIRKNIFGHDGSCADNCSCCNMNTRADYDICRNQYIVIDHNDLTQVF